MVSNNDFHGLATLRRRISRYDLVLAIVPMAFLVAGIASLMFVVPIDVLLPAAAAVGALTLIDGLFVNPPRTGSGTA